MIVSSYEQDSIKQELDIKQEPATTNPKCLACRSIGPELAAILPATTKIAAA